MPNLCTRKRLEKFTNVKHDIASSAGSIISAKQMFGLRKTETIVGVCNVKNWEERAIRN